MLIHPSNYLCNRNVTQDGLFHDLICPDELSKISKILQIQIPTPTWISLVSNLQQKVGPNIIKNLHFWIDINSSPYIISLLRDGVKLAFINKPQSNVKWFQQKTNPVDAPFIEKEILNLLDKGANQTVLDPQEIEKLFIVRIFTVPKRDSLDRRPCLDLRPLNRYIKKKAFKMENLTTVRNMLYPNAFLTKIDVKDAFLHIPIHQDHQTYLAFNWKGKTKAEARKNTMVIIEHLVRLGFIINMEKYVTEPTQELEYLGHTINTVSMEFKMTEKRRLDIKRTGIAILKSRSTTPRSLASFLGKIQSLQQATGPLRSKVRINLVGRRNFKMGWSLYHTVNTNLIHNNSRFQRRLGRHYRRKNSSTTMAPSIHRPKLLEPSRASSHSIVSLPLHKGLETASYKSTNSNIYRQYDGFNLHKQDGWQNPSIERNNCRPSSLLEEDECLSSSLSHQGYPQHNSRPSFENLHGQQTRGKSVNGSLQYNSQQIHETHNRSLCLSIEPQVGKVHYNPTRRFQVQMEQAGLSLHSSTSTTHQPYITEDHGRKGSKCDHNNTQLENGTVVPNSYEDENNRPNVLQSSISNSQLSGNVLVQQSQLANDGPSDIIQFLSSKNIPLNAIKQLMEGIK
eukprot:gene2912-3629_t